MTTSNAADGPTVARTIAQALPLLSAADSVRLLIVETDARRTTPVDSMLAYLRRHAPGTTVQAVTALLRPVGKSIPDEAQVFGASLIAMSANEQSRKLPGADDPVRSCGAGAIRSAA